MKKNLLFLFIVSFAMLFVNCTDNVDESDMYTFVGQTVKEFLQENNDYSEFYGILNKVKFSNKSKSYVAELMGTRGHYTVFAPTNNAIEQFLDSIDYKNMNQIEQDSINEYIVRNSIIDTKNADAIASTDFIEGALSYTNMNDRYITISFAAGMNKSEVIVNDKSKIISKDNYLSNGIVHGIDHVLELSNSSLGELLAQTPNTQIFAYILKKTGWFDSLYNYRDEVYERSAKMPNVEGQLPPEHRYIGFTAFVEKDALFQQKWHLPQLEKDQNGNVKNWDEIWPKIVEKCKALYPTATNEDFKNQDNAVNRFIAYHLLPERLTWEYLIIHHAEMGYSFNYPEQLSVDCYEYYETIGKNRWLLKLTEGAKSGGKRINRKVKYDYGKNGTELEPIEEIIPGLTITNGNRDTIQMDNEQQTEENEKVITYTNQSLNGFYYMIDDILVYNDDVANKVLNERIRWDVSSWFPELMTNGYRKIKTNDWYYMPKGYLSRIVKMGEGCNYRYVPYYYSFIENYQGDEHNIAGQYDLTLKLPPVPFRGTWEVRISVAHYSQLGMAQLYLGKNPNNLQPMGLPVDLRTNVPEDKTVGYVLDGSDWELNFENDKQMRNRGWMKPPYHDGVRDGRGTKVTSSLRTDPGMSKTARLRRIMGQMTMDPDETWYIRIKNVLENTSASFEFDYFEYAPKWVYAGTEKEDIW